MGRSKTDFSRAAAHGAKRPSCTPTTASSVRKAGRVSLVITTDFAPALDESVKPAPVPTENARQGFEQLPACDVFRDETRCGRRV